MGLLKLRKICLLFNLLFIASLAMGSVDLENFRFYQNTLSSTNTNGDILIDPAGTGKVKFSDLTATTVPYLDASKGLVSSAVTPTELGYVSGVTSAIQTQINTKQATISVTDTTTIDHTLTGAAISADIQPLSITNALINASAAIAYSKLNLATSIVNADISGSAAIAYSKLNLTGNVANADLAGSIAASKLVGSDISTVGTVTTGTWSATTIALNKGGTGQTTKSAAFDALSPMSASGDIIYGGASGTGTRLAKGSDTQVLTLASGVPTWAPPVTGFANPMTTGGDIIYGGASGVATRLANGSAGQVLTSAGGTSAPTWSTRGFLPLSARYTTATAGSYGASDTVVNYGTSVYDANSIVTTGASWHVTIPSGYDGNYLVCAHVLFESQLYAANNQAYMNIRINGTNYSRLDTNIAEVASTEYLPVGNCDIVPLVATNTLDIVVFNNRTAGNATLNAGALTNTFSIQRVQ